MPEEEFLITYRLGPGVWSPRVPSAIPDLNLKLFHDCQHVAGVRRGAFLHHDLAQDTFPG
jgi:hypothetical protein